MKQPQYSTAFYMRLSRDDETFGDSVSIKTQRTVLTQYVKEHLGFHVVSEFVDDGWSGTNFDRPQFKRMMEEIEAGNINCIISKNMTRWGRDYLQVGNTMEVFRRNNVRFIAVNNGSDREKPDTLEFAPFINSPLRLYKRPGQQGFLDN